MRYGLCFVLVLFPAGLAQAQPASVWAEFSGIYDSFKHRRHIPNCPSEAEAAPRIWHALSMWEHLGEGAMTDIRRISEMPGFPRVPVVIYFVACGRGISNPVTVAVYKGGPDGPFIPLSDDELIADITHELLHNVANTAAYADLQEMVNTAYPEEEAEVRNHIVVSALEVRIYGYEVMRKRYAFNANYARALELGVRFGITSRDP